MIKLAASLSALEGAGRDVLVRQWIDLVGAAPPPNTSTKVLRSAVTYELQTKALGAVPKRMERVLANALPDQPCGLDIVAASAPVDRAISSAMFGEIGSDVAVTKVPASESPVASTPVRKAQTKLTLTLAPGTQLVREWNGRTWQVEVVKGGFVCKGKRYRSLSAIAKMITSAHWSGPHFFGLRS